MMGFSRAINEDGLLYVPYAEVKDQETEIKQELKTLRVKLEVYKKALELMANDVFLDVCEHKYDKCESLFIYQIPCQECIECIINDYLQKVREKK